MVEQVEIEKFLNPTNKSIPVIDVRSPKEYEKAHIPEAINFPIFTTEERAAVGTCYKNEGRESAILLGLKYVGPKLEQFAKKARELAVDDCLAVHCWRGGMRSSSMAWLFSTVGIRTIVLKGGYKSYRKFIKEHFAKKMNLVVLGGMTGSGKTEVLQEIAKKGHQVVDLEGLANHKGSAFGGIGQKEQPTTEQFENNLYEQLKAFDFEQPVWVEDESKTIGRIGVPDELYLQIRSSLVVNLEIPIEERVDWLFKKYGCFPSEDLKSAMFRIKKRLGGKDYNLAVESIDNGEIKKAAELALRYYDKAYQYGLSKRKSELVHSIKCEKLNAEINADKIIAFYQNIIR